MTAEPDTDPIHVHEQLTNLRSHPRYGPILDRALSAWFDPLVQARVSPRRHGYGSYPLIQGADADANADQPLYAPCGEKSCCLLGAARIGLPAGLSKYASILGISQEEVIALTAGFDAENEPELERAVGGFPNGAEAVRFGHEVAVSLGLPFDHMDAKNRPILAAFVAIIDSRCRLDGVPALLTIQRTAKGVGVSIPGGSVEPGETVAEAAVRELYEEIGAEVPKRDLIVLGTSEWEGRPIVTYVVDLAEPNSVRLDVEISNRVYSPVWRPYTVLLDAEQAAFPEWSCELCHRLYMFLRGDDYDNLMGTGGQEPESTTATAATGA